MLLIAIEPTGLVEVRDLFQATVVGKVKTIDPIIRMQVVLPLEDLILAMEHIEVVPTVPDIEVLQGAVCLGPLGLVPVEIQDIEVLIGLTAQVVLAIEALAAQEAPVDIEVREVQEVPVDIEALVAEVTEVLVAEEVLEACVLVEEDHPEEVELVNNPLNSN